MFKFSIHERHKLLSSFQNGSSHFNGLNNNNKNMPANNKNNLEKKKLRKIKSFFLNVLEIVKYKIHKMQQ